MDPYIKLTEELFSAARSEFKHLEYFYFHNCPYEAMWKDNRRRHVEKFLPGRSYILTVLIINVFLLVMHR